MMGKWVIRVHVQQDIIFALKTGAELFYQFRPQGFLKMADDRTGSVRSSSLVVCVTSVQGCCAN